VPEVIALGEILVDLIPFEVGDYTKVKGFSLNFGGAPFNYAIAVARLGHSVGAICCVGDDPFGDFLLNVLRKEGVDVSRVKVKRARTSLAFVVRQPRGGRDFFFYRRPWVTTADSMLEPKDVDEDYIRSARILHLSGVILSHEPARSAAFKAMEVAREAGVIVSFDPNVRLDLWESREELLRVYDEVFKRCDIALVSHDEADVLFGTTDPREVASKVRERYNPRYVAVKLGPRGAYVVSREEVELEPFDVEVVDITGAGDAWAAGFEVMLLEGQSLRDCVLIANAVASIAVTRVGAITALPTREELRSFLRKWDVKVEV